MAGAVAGYFPLVRPLNVVMSAVAVAIGGVVAVGPEGLAAPGRGIGTAPLVLDLAWASLSAALFAAAGNVLNDYFDRDVDKRNHPDRPIPSGEVSPTQARRLAVELFLVSIVALGVTANGTLLAIWAVNLAAMVAYERTFKGRGLSGNLLVAYLVGSLFIFGGVAVAPLFAADVLLRSGVLVLLAAVATLGREIVKDIEDVAGDVNRVTLPKRIGVGPAGAAAAVAFGSGVALSVVPWLANVLGPGYVLVAVADGMFIYAAMVSARRPSSSQRVAKYAMLAALLAFLLGA